MSAVSKNIHNYDNGLNDTGNITQHQTDIRSAITVGENAGRERLSQTHQDIIMSKPNRKSSQGARMQRNTKISVITPGSDGFTHINPKSRYQGNTAYYVSKSHNMGAPGTGGNSRETNERGGDLIQDIRAQIEDG